MESLASFCRDSPPWTRAPALSHDEAPSSIKGRPKWNVGIPTGVMKLTHYLTDTGVRRPGPGGSRSGPRYEVQGWIYVRSMKLGVKEIGICFRLLSSKSKSKSNCHPTRPLICSMATLLRTGKDSELFAIDTKIRTCLVGSYWSRE